ncbi:MAG: metal ABC transporter ATP-binding protein [Planctomycetes bacterium]|nr:metal ABC transporter ATP-binding protein [Planctomycetota bacterium]
MTELRLADVTVCYGKDPAVHHLDLALPFGSLVALLGPNGAGKSTLMRAILGWLPLTTGTITVAGRPLADVPERIAYLPQRSLPDVDFPISVREVVAMGRHALVGAWRRFSAEDTRAVDSAITEMGLDRLQDRQLGTLSGGQVQRALLARALATGADIFLLDEPFAGLDAAAVTSLARSLRQWVDRGRLVVAVVHDLALVRSSFTHAVLLRSHLIAHGAPDAVLSTESLAAAFGGRATALFERGGGRI